MALSPQLSAGKEHEVPFLVIHGLRGGEERQADYW